MIMGNVYPVTEDPFSKEDSLHNKPCKEGYDSHYALVNRLTDRTQDNSFIPSKAHQQPDFDEIVIFNADQILPRYLVYFTITRPSATVLWLSVVPSSDMDILEEEIEKQVLFYRTFMFLIIHRTKTLM